MRKDFDIWNGHKKEIDQRPRLFFHEREIWWCQLGVNVGFEQDGKGKKFARPVLVFKKFNKEVFWALPLSTKIKKSRFYAEFLLDDQIPRVAIVSQLRLMDARRLIDKFGVVKEEDYRRIQKAVIDLCQ